MSKEYIEKEAAVENAKDIISYLNDLYNDGWLTITDADWRVLMGMLLSVANISSAKVAPVVDGKWIDKFNKGKMHMQSFCSVCGKRSGIGGIESNRHKPFCPNCGADMRTEKNDD